MFAQLIMAAWCAALVVIFSAPNAAARWFGTAVKVNAVAKGTTPQGTTIYMVNYSYEFKKRDTVYVKGLGLVPAKGKFDYFTDNPRVEFLDFAGGRVIAALSTPTTFASLGKVLFPRRDADFPQVGRDELWAYSSPFQGAVKKALNKRKLTYWAYERDQLFYLLSTYASLEDLPKNLRVKTALLISHPYRAQGGKVWFRVQSTARERRIKEEWRDSLSEEAQEASDNFVDRFVKELLDIGKSGR